MESLCGGDQHARRCDTIVDEHDVLVVDVWERSLPAKHVERALELALELGKILRDVCSVKSKLDDAIELDVRPATFDDDGNGTVPRTDQIDVRAQCRRDLNTDGNSLARHGENLQRFVFVWFELFGKCTTCLSTTREHVGCSE